MLKIEGLQVSYNGSLALRDIDIEIAEGELVAVIGPNGAGKSTLLRTISGLVRKSAGKIVFDGDDVSSTRADALVRRGIVHVPEGRMVLGRMSVLENLQLGCYCRPAGEDPSVMLERVFDLFPVLRERFRQQAWTLSGGEQQMLAIGRALMGRPRLLMLDEPSLGLAPLIVTAIFEVLEEIRRQGVTVLLVEQNAERALRAAAHAYVLDLGQMTARGSGKDLLMDERVRSAYLGI